MNFTHGFIIVLHTFGRDLKWNPHIHYLTSENDYSDNGFWRNINYFIYAFRTALLNELETKIDSSFKKVKVRCYWEHKDGFYVYAKPNKCSPNTVIKYIRHYLRLPVIASSGIDKYENESVTFHYNRHENGAYVEETIPIMEFIERLIQHISERIQNDLIWRYLRTPPGDR